MWREAYSVFEKNKQCIESICRRGVVFEMQLIMTELNPHADSVGREVRAQ